jgi:hypothetical protein
MLAALLAITALAAAPAPSLIDCPRTLAVEQKAVSLPSGWSAADDGSPHRLAGVTFFDGPPAELASLKYDETASASGEWTGIWHFEPNPRGFWIACSFSGTSIVLSRRLPAEVKVCRVSYAKERGEGPVGDIKKIDCR